MTARTLPRLGQIANQKRNWLETLGNIAFDVMCFALVLIAIFYACEFIAWQWNCNEFLLSHQ